MNTKTETKIFSPNKHLIKVIPMGVGWGDIPQKPSN